MAGLAVSPKRTVKDNDLEQFRQLLSLNHEVDEVLLMMETHPQMPLGIDVNEVFEQSISKLRGNFSPNNLLRI